MKVVDTAAQVVKPMPVPGPETSSDVEIVATATELFENVIGFVVGLLPDRVAFRVVAVAAGGTAPVTPAMFKRTCWMLMKSPTLMVVVALN